MNNYFIYLYPGYGIELVKFYVAGVADEQDALEKLCSTLSSIFFRPVRDLEEDELTYCEEYSDLYVYIDASSYNGECGYLCIENMKIEQAE